MSGEWVYGNYCENKINSDSNIATTIIEFNFIMMIPKFKKMGLE